MRSQRWGEKSIRHIDLSRLIFNDLECFGGGRGVESGGCVDRLSLTDVGSHGEIGRGAEVENAGSLRKPQPPDVGLGQIEASPARSSRASR